LNVFFYVFQDEVIIEKCCLLGHLHFIEPTHGLLSWIECIFLYFRMRSSLKSATFLTIFILW
jgi:hypothetical protein